ncbi:MAG TPA: hypothetical protein VKA91_05725, partial [Nitrososphaeraceae archaeon]|nr:hypothetical protein [Nitrososphaeraceae archaeon]
PITCRNLIPTSSRGALYEDLVAVCIPPFVLSSSFDIGELETLHKLVLSRFDPVSAPCRPAPTSKYAVN